MEATAIATASTAAGPNSGSSQQTAAAVQPQGNQRDVAAAVWQQQHGGVDEKIASRLEWQWQK